MVKCDFCNMKVDREVAHSPHEFGCDRNGCQCDLWAHEKCCPDCTDVESDETECASSVSPLGAA